MTTRPDTPELPWPTPQTPGELHRWLREVLDVQVPMMPLLPSSTAPWDYLSHAFFEGRIPGSAPRATADCVVWASRGGGKTFLGAVATMLDLVFKPGIEVRILGGSLEQSRRMYEHLRELFARPALAGLVDGRITERQVRLKSRARAQVLAQSQTAIRGTRVQKLRCDEVDLFDPEAWEAAQLTTRSVRMEGPWGSWVRGSVEALSTMHRPMGVMWGIVGAARPPSEQPGEGEPVRARTLFRWGVVDTLAACEAQRACEPCPLRAECDGRAKARPEGAAGHVAIDDAIAQKARVSTAAWESEMLCLRARRSDAVFPEFDESRHLIADEPLTPRQDRGSRRRAHPGRPALLCGVDFGFRAPTVVLWATLDHQGVLRVVDERYVRESRLQTHIDAIVDGPLGPPDWVGVDPAGLQRSDQTGCSNVDVMRRAGLTVHARKLDVPVGLELIRARLDPAAAAVHRRSLVEADDRIRDEPSPPPAAPETGPPVPRLLVARRCVHLIEALARYHYDPDQPHSLVPVKDGHDHAIDALRYLVVPLDRPHNTTAKSYVSGGGAGYWRIQGTNTSTRR